MTLAVPSLVARARTAQANWGARPIKERAAALADMRRWLVTNRDAIIESTMRETGKTYEDALVGEVFLLADSLRYWERKAGRAVRHARPGARTARPRAQVRRAPAPARRGRSDRALELPARCSGIGDAVPALMAGNAVVIKPSEITP